MMENRVFDIFFELLKTYFVMFSFVFIVLEARDYVDRVPDQHIFLIRQKGVVLQ